MATSSASFSGSHHGSTHTIEPTSMCLVRPAMYVNSCNGSGIRQYGVKWCSTDHSASKPSSSACRKMSRWSCHAFQSGTPAVPTSSSPRSMARNRSQSEKFWNIIPSDSRMLPPDVNISG